MSRFLARLAALVVPLSVLAVVGPPTGAAVGDQVIAWVEVEDGVIAGGPGFNAGDHSNFSGTGSYTFRETGMSSTMSVTAPAAGVYPVHVRYAAGPLSAEENVTRSMGLLTNGGARQQMSLPMTSTENWEAWRFVTYDVTLAQGANTIALACDRGVDFCRLNFDAIQVGGTAPDPCVATVADPGYTSLFDGTFASFDGWRKAGVGGFGRQTDCTIRSIRGRGAEWHTQQLSEPYTLKLDWRRTASNDDSAVHLASTSRAGADPVGGYTIPIGADTASIVPTGGAAQTPNRTALAAALHPLGEWNTYTIQVTRTRVRLQVNGTVVNTVERAAGGGASGFIGLENRSGSDEVDFRAIQVRPDVELGRIAAPYRGASSVGESPLGNLVADVQRWATRTPSAGGAQLALVDPTSLGADLTGTPGDYPTTVTYQQAALSLPAADTLVNLRLTGAQLRTVLEQQWQRTAGGAVPARPFVRLATSSGFTTTDDPTRAEGSRITGMWLDGTPIDPATSYSVTVSSALAAGGSNFRALAVGTSRLDSGRTALTALADHLTATADPAVGGTALVPTTAQRTVGVSVPGGAPASYAPGAALQLDLSSLAFAAAGVVADTAVQVTVAGRSLGSFPVQAGTADAYDAQGRAEVRATLPADLPAGPTTVGIVGADTGTTVSVPITVAAPASPAPPAPVATTKATPRLGVTVRPGKVVAGRTRPTLVVAVTAPGVTPTGTVRVKVGGKTYRGTLRGGTVAFRLARFAKPGKVKVVVTYAGDTATAAGSRTVKITVRKR